MPPAQADQADQAEDERRALADRARTAREHAEAIAAYQADLAVAREVLPAPDGAAFGTAEAAALDAREQLIHLVVLLEAIRRVRDGAGTGADHRILGAAPRAPVASARPDGRPELDTVRALLADAACELGPRAGRRSEHRLADASPAELTIVGDLVELGLTFDQLVQVLDGGHLLVPGHAALERWRTLPGAHPRPSSHYRDLTGPDAGPQYGLAGRFTHEVLFGPGPHRSTFVQLERAAPTRAALPRHLADWVEYRATHRNQGPYGSSAFTDAQPLRIVLVTAGDPDVAIARVGAIATAVQARTSVLEPELSLAPVVGRVPAAPTYDEALAITVETFTRAGHTLRALAASLDR